MTVDWQMVGALSSLAYAVTFLISIVAVVIQLRREEQAAFVATTGALFAVWADDDFQRALQWVLYELDASTWKDFMAKYRGEYGERAFIRVGSYFNRAGYLVTHHLVGRNDRILLDNVSGPAIAAWEKIGPLVLEARLIQNSTLFQDYERMLPDCYACFEPTEPIPEHIREGAEHAAELERAELYALTHDENLTHQ